jgi:hypothetical protein
MKEAAPEFRLFLYARESIGIRGLDVIDGIFRRFGRQIGVAHFAVLIGFFQRPDCLRHMVVRFGMFHFGGPGVLQRHRNVLGKYVGMTFLSVSKSHGRMLQGLAGMMFDGVGHAGSNHRQNARHRYDCHQAFHMNLLVLSITQTPAMRLLVKSFLKSIATVLETPRDLVVQAEF